MSVQQEIKRLTAPDIRARKGGEPTCAAASLGKSRRFRVDVKQV